MRRGPRRHLAGQTPADTFFRSMACGTDYKAEILAAGPGPRASADAPSLPQLSDPKPLQVDAKHSVIAPEAPVAPTLAPRAERSEPRPAPDCWPSFGA